MLITCPYGLSSMLNNELKRLGYSTNNTFDTGTYVDTSVYKKKETKLTELYMAAHINMRSRVANKVYIPLLTQRNVNTFDDLFEAISTVDRSQYIPLNTPLVVKIHTRQSLLHATRTIQSVIHKSIISKLTGSKDGHREIDDTNPDIGIYIILNQNKLQVYVNTSGKGLHNRGYRTQAGEAPIKENIAAALIHMSGRHWSHPLRDPCCGAGTIPIEAAMMARNIAPGLGRSFSLEQFPCMDNTIVEKLHNDAVEGQYDDKKFTIFGSDIDYEMINIAQENAKNAGVADTIRFIKLNIHETGNDIGGTAISESTLITNPPYDNRLEDFDAKEIHKKIGGTLTRKSVCITGYDQAMSHFHTQHWKFRKVKNGPDMVTIYSSK